MLGFDNQDPKHHEALEQVRQWTRERFELPTEAVILVAEIACALPGCPPLETVVAFWLDDKRHQFKIFKRPAEVILEDLPPVWLKDALAGSDVVEFSCC
jgi:hypothetical protein